MSRFHAIDVTLNRCQRPGGERTYTVCFAAGEPVEVRVRQRMGWHTLWLQGEPFKNRIAMDAIKAARAA